MSDLTDRLRKTGNNGAPRLNNGCFADLADEAADTLDAKDKQIEGLTARCIELGNFADGYGKLDADLAIAESTIASLREEVERLRNLVEEAALQIEYLHDKFTPTGSGNSVLARLRTALGDQT